MRFRRRTAAEPPPAVGDAPVNRRGLLRTGAAAAAAGAGMLALGRQPAEAATGGGVVLDAVNASDSTTSLVANQGTESYPVLLVDASALPSGAAIQAVASAGGAAVAGTSVSGHAITGRTTSTLAAVYGVDQSGIAGNGVEGLTARGKGVRGTATSGYGVYGVSDSGDRKSVV